MGRAVAPYDKFVCVESVAYQPVVLAGGQQWVGRMSLVPEPLAMAAHSGVKVDAGSRGLPHSRLGCFLCGCALLLLRAIQRGCPLLPGKVGGTFQGSVVAHLFGAWGCDAECLFNVQRSPGYTVHLVIEAALGLY